jgi:hypothetical protein
MGWNRIKQLCQTAVFTEKEPDRMHIFLLGGVGQKMMGDRVFSKID